MTTTQPTNLAGAVPPVTPSGQTGTPASESTTAASSNVAAPLGSIATSSVGNLQFTFDSSIDTAKAADRITRIVSGNPVIWDESISYHSYAAKDGHPSTWTGWVNAPSRSLTHIDFMKTIMIPATNEQVLLIGTGGSGLGAEVQMFGKENAFVLDGLDPAEIRSTLSKLDPKKVTVFVASKSGTTGEITLIDSEVRRWMKAGEGDPSKQFIGITDDPKKSGSIFSDSTDFRSIILGVDSIGGRYSCHSVFGVAPSLAAGIDTESFLKSASVAETKYKEVTLTDPDKTEGLLGVQIENAIKQALSSGRNKLIIRTGKGLEKTDFWASQLINESLAKGDRSPVAIAGEPLAENSTSYREDRVFLQFEIGKEEKVEVLPTYEDGGTIHNVPTIKVTIPEGQTGALLYHMEWAVALLGLDLKVHPFNQPAVEIYKVELKTNLASLAKGEDVSSIAAKALDAEAKSVLTGDINALSSKANGYRKEESLHGVLSVFLNSLRGDQYVGILSATNRNDEYDTAISDIRKLLVDDGLSTISGYIPRRCHSDNQLSVAPGFDQVAEIIFTFDNPDDIAVGKETLTKITGITDPSESVTLGQVNRVIANSLFQALNRNNKNALIIHLPREFRDNPEKLVTAFRDALSS